MNFKPLFKLARENGIEDIQVTFRDHTKFSINVDNNELTEYSIAGSSRLSVKGLYNGQMGMYSTEKISSSEFMTIVDKIKESAGSLNVEEEQFIYEGSKSYRKLKSYNSKLQMVDTKDKLDLCYRVNKATVQKENVVRCMTAYEEVDETLVMENSKGLKLKQHSNGFEVYNYVIASKEGDTRVGSAFWVNNNFSTVNENNLIENAYNEAVSSLGAKPVKSRDYEVVIDEGTTAQLINCFSGFYSSERVQKNLSLLKDKIGEKIGSDCVTLVDDPFTKDSLNVTGFDAEGVATSYKEIVKDGVLMGYFYNLKTAKKDGVESTGNATQSGCAPINFHFKPGRKSKEAMIKSVKDGLLITSLQGIHAGANQMSGDFSLQATGYRIEKGKVTTPVALITVSQNYFDLLKEVTAVSNRLKNGVDSPAIQVAKVSVSGL